MIDTLALVKEASYGFLGGPLARGNFRVAKSSGYLPFFVNPDAVQTGFLMQNMQAPHGWDPKVGAVKFDGVDSYVKNEVLIDHQSAEYTMFLDVDDPVSGSVSYTYFGFGYLVDGVHENGNKAQIFRYGPSPQTPTQVGWNGVFKSEYKAPTNALPARNQISLAAKDLKAFRCDDNSWSEFDSSVSVEPAPNYNRITLGTRPNAGAHFANCSIHTAIIFPRMLTEEEISWLHEQSLLGFPGIKADAYGPNLEYAELSRTRARRRSFGLGYSYKYGC